MARSDSKIIHVEVQQKSESDLYSWEIEEKVKAYLYEQGEIISGSVLSGEVVSKHVHSIRICSNSEEKISVDLNDDNIDIRFYIYQTCSIVPQYESLDADENDSAACLNWTLPNSEFNGLWESLFLEGDMKMRLLKYLQTALLYSKSRVSSNIVKWNRVVLLHGPPGTGKTTLCKALAQKLSVRLCNTYKNGHLIEINTHSLFSKWFSESPKLVFKMFNSIKQWLEFDENFVFILMDEVESLTLSRESRRSDPSDAIRVVNTVLTQLDQLQRYQNYVILATSNVVDSIDTAFADRADLKLFLGYPNKWAVYEILRSCLEELIRCNLISDTSGGVCEADILKKSNKVIDGGHLMSEVLDNSHNLLKLSALCEGMSGRTLRKVPFLTSTALFETQSPNIKDFINAMKDIVTDLKIDDKKYFKENHSLI